MKTLNKMRFIPLLLTLSLLAMMAVPTMSMADPPTTPPMVDLGTAANFAVLAGSTITNTGSSVIYNGDLGLSPGTSVTGFPPGAFAPGTLPPMMTGTEYVADTAAAQAQIDTTAAYVYAARQAPTTTYADGFDLGGQTLVPGVYKSASSLGLTGILTLDAQGDPNAVFIFQMGSTLTTATDSTVYLTPGTLPCHVFWQVGSSATLGAGSTFNGTILALTSITANAGVTVYGRLLARNGAVTLISDNITNTVCPGTTLATVTGTPAATLTVIKHVINGTAVASDFKLHVTSSGIDVANSPLSGAESPGTAYALAAGTYVVSEDAYAGYTASYSVDGTNSTSGNIALASGTTNNTVTITNTYTPGGGGGAPLIPPLIKVIKTPSPTALTGSGSVTYTYTVTNPGTVALSNVSVTDNKVSPVTYVSGDVNHDNLLEPGETWIYTSKTNVDATTTNTATAKGSANGNTATGIASATVVVTSPVVVTPVVTPPVVVTPTVASPVVTPPVVVTRTVTGGQIPKTSTPFSIPMYELLLIGAALTLFGAVGWRKRKRYE